MTTQHAPLWLEPPTHVVRACKAAPCARTWDYTDETFALCFQGASKCFCEGLERRLTGDSDQGQGEAPAKDTSCCHVLPHDQSSSAKVSAGIRFNRSIALRHLQESHGMRSQRNA